MANPTLFVQKRRHRWLEAVCFVLPEGPPFRRPVAEKAYSVMGFETRIGIRDENFVPCSWTRRRSRPRRAFRVRGRV